MSCVRVQSKAVAKWEEMQSKSKHRKRALPHVTDLEYPHDTGAGLCCHVAPPLAVTDPSATTTQQLVRAGTELLTVAKLPFVLALLVALLLTMVVAYGVVLVLVSDINVMLSDVQLMDDFEALVSAPRPPHVSIIHPPCRPSSLALCATGSLPSCQSPTSPTVPTVLLCLVSWLRRATPPYAISD